MKTVLIIDDDPIQRTICSKFLATRGWQVLEAEDGQAGIEMALKHKPRAVVCDLLMPRCNGFQVCRTIRSNAELSQTRVVVSSSRAYGTDRLGALEAGADAYLVKPVDLEELIQVLEQPMPARPAAPATTVRSPAANEPALAPSSDQPVRIKFWGVRGSLPTPGSETAFFGGNTSCVSVRANGEIIVLDAGTGIRALGKELVAEFKDRPISLTLLISHTHWDHIQGFPFFSPAYDPRNRLRILGYEGSRKGLEATLASQMESPYFPIGLSEMPGHIVIEEVKDLQFSIGKVGVNAWFLNHPGICMGYRLATPAGTIVYAPDNEPSQRFRLHAAGAAAKGPEAAAFARSEDAKLVEFVRGADVLIIDAQYDAAEYQQRVGWGHGCLDDVVALAVEAQVKRLFLFHHDPDHDDGRIQRRVAHARELAAKHGSGMLVEAAREGLEVVL